MAQPLDRTELFGARADERLSLFWIFSSGCGQPPRRVWRSRRLVLVARRVVAEGRYWRSIDTTSAPSTVASATLLGSRGKVRMLEPPHTEDNYLLKEMGFAIARKHRVRLRGVVRLAAFALLRSERCSRWWSAV